MTVTVLFTIPGLGINGGKDRVEPESVQQISAACSEQEQNEYLYELLVPSKVSDTPDSMAVIIATVREKRIASQPPSDLSTSPVNDSLLSMP
ncbi:hypothetical protein [Aeromonas salmonicida]|uniref:hypothetical protein n=1 Tax=Aeromonas salmonicida TaxID=645 RepID=UPI001F35E99B|nr:hypothetical protein [Aeromonas salmonicida]MCE9933950.1 hypothetical protein [Aeromonas salmonicida]